jgi:hypothetical protein
MRTPHTSLARSRTGCGEHCGEGEIAFRPGPAPGRVRGPGGDQDPGDFGVALDVAGEGLRELRSLQAGGHDGVHAELPVMNEVCAQSRQRAVDASPRRRRSTRPLQGCQGAHHRVGRQLIYGHPLGGRPVIPIVS